MSCRIRFFAPVCATAWFVCAVAAGALQSPKPAPAPAAAEEQPLISWEPIGSFDTIRVFRRQYPGNPVLAYRGEGTLPAPLKKLVMVVTDTPSKPQWMSRVKSAEVVRRLSATEQVEYVQVQLPWPLKDRDMLYKARLEVDAKARKVTLFYESIEDPLRPVVPGLVRARIYPSRFVLTPSADSKGTFVEAEAHFDPNGSIPKWLVNLYQRRVPKESFQGLMKRVVKPGIIPHPLLDDFPET